MTLILAFLAGLLTLINPCVLPVLPIVLASALQDHRHGPLALALGMSLSFTAFGITPAAAGRALGLTETAVSQTAAVFMVPFGLTLLVPRAKAAFALATAGLSARSNRSIDGPDSSGLTGQALTGALLGVVWRPCVGPRLGGAISLASQGNSFGLATATLPAFALGVSAVILALAYGTRAALQRGKIAMQSLANRSKPLMGATLITLGLILLFHLIRPIESWAISVLPIWLQDLSVTC